MLKAPLLPLIAAICLFYSCSNSSKTDTEIIKAMEESLKNSNMTIDYSTQTILHELNNKVVEPSTHEKAEFWFPKAKEISRLSKECFDYIEILKKRVFPCRNPQIF